MSKSTAMLLALGMFGTGAVGSIGYQAFAQTPPTSNPTETSAGVLADSVDDVDTDQTEIGVSETAKTLAGNSWSDDDADEVGEVEPSLPSGGVTEAQARALIMAAHPGVTIMKIELEDEDGVLLYGAEFSDRTEVNVNAATGAVILDPEDADDAKDGETDDD